MKPLVALLCLVALTLATAGQDLPRFLDKLDLTAAQKEKVAALRKKHLPAIKELQSGVAKEMAAALEKVLSSLDDKQKAGLPKDLKFASFLVL